jgi:hypothetical protein
VGVRFVALDRLRALAVVSMVQGHTFSALMKPDALPATVMQWHALVHGLTAPAFLFGAGLAFGLATYPRYERHRHVGPVLYQRLRRYAWLVLLGYALQLPGASLLAALRLRADELTPVLRVGPLHLIALCLMACQLSALGIKSPRAHALLSFTLGALVSASSPYVYAANLGQLSGPLLGPWLDASSGSLFPIFPWASFAFFGVATGGLLAHRPRALPRSTLWVSLGLLLAGSAYMLFLKGIRLSDPKWFWHASPLNTVFRIGLVLCLLGVLHRFAGPPTQAAPPVEAGAASGRRVRTSPHAPVRPREGWTGLLARHSLLAFVVHLLLLYGTPFTPSLNHHFGLSLDAPEACAVFVAIMLATLLAIRTWASLQQERRLDPGWVRALLTVLGVLVLTR